MANVRNPIAWATAIVICHALSSRASADVNIYADSLATGWQNWSWSTTVNFANTNPVNGGSGNSIAVTHTAAWAGLYLHAPSNLAASQFVSFRFVMHGGNAGGQQIEVRAYDANSNAGPVTTIAPIPANTWITVTIPIANLGVSQISGFTWQDRSGGAQPTYFLDDIALISTGAPPPPLSFAVDAAGNPRPISEDIYGMNFADAALAADLRLPVRRWGGNATTRYNYLLDTFNTASDWYFENIPNDNSSPQNLPNGSAADQFVEQDRATGTKTIMTLPLIGWTPKSRAISWGFSVMKYGAQQSVDPWHSDAGNGVRTNGTLIANNDPLDTSIAITPSFVQNWIAHLVSRYGAAAQGGVAFYDLDNEPMLWDDTHRDVHPQPTSYNELRDRAVQYGAAIKAADPTAKTLGPVVWGWTAYFYSALDWAPGGSWWNNPLDRLAHGNTPFIDWYLQQMQGYQAAHNLRILDYLDLHYYPQANGVALSSAGDASTQALRLRSTRSLWDPTYGDESWIGEAVRLIPRMHDWVNTNYPGTKLAITEYNWGALDDINGALAQADVLGIFGREGLDLATLWDPPQSSDPGAYAFRMYRNYDGNGSRFGSTAINATGTDQDQVSIYAALRADRAMTLLLINKSTATQAGPMTISDFPVGGDAQAWRYSSVNLSQIVQLANVPVVNSVLNASLPPSSITLYVIPRTACAADISPGANGDGVVNVNDLLAVINAWGASSGPADINHDGVVNVADLLSVINGWGTCP